jgi:hypothetical protein
MLVFSQKLINETIQCFKEENNLDISEETANEYLKYFAGLFLAFSKRQETDSAGLLMKPDEAVSAKIL